MQQSKYVTPHFLHRFLAIQHEDSEAREKDDVVEPLVIGIGGSGSNMIDQLSDQINATTLATNTDARHLREVTTDRKLLLGLELTKGEGSGNQPKLGQEAAIRERSHLMEIYEQYQTAFLITGLGGGTGSGATPVFAELARRSNVFTVAITTFPFRMEGKIRHDNAFHGLDMLEEICDIVVLIPNDNLEGLSDLPIYQAFEQVDTIISNLVQVLIKVTQLNTSPDSSTNGVAVVIQKELEDLELTGLKHMNWEFEDGKNAAKFYLLPTEYLNIAV